MRATYVMLPSPGSTVWISTTPLKSIPTTSMVLTKRPALRVRSEELRTLLREDTTALPVVKPTGSPSELELHYQSKRHQNRAATQEQGEMGHPATGGDQDTTQKHVDSNQNPAETAREPLIVSQEIREAAKAAHRENGEAIIAANIAQRKYHCAICDLALGKPSYLEVHNLTPAHLKKAVSLGELDDDGYRANLEAWASQNQQKASPGFGMESQECCRSEILLQHL